MISCCSAAKFLMVENQMPLSGMHPQVVVAAAFFGWWPTAALALPLTLSEYAGVNWFVIA